MKKNLSSQMVHIIESSLAIDLYGALHIDTDILAQAKEIAISTGYDWGNVLLSLSNTLPHEKLAAHPEVWFASINDDMWPRNSRMFACECAARVLPLFRKHYPKNELPIRIIQTSLNYSIGESTREELAAALTAGIEAKIELSTLHRNRKYTSSKQKSSSKAAFKAFASAVSTARELSLKANYLSAATASISAAEMAVYFDAQSRSEDRIEHLRCKSHENKNQWRILVRIMADSV